jgi:hypothetical protein
VQNLKGV